MTLLELCQTGIPGYDPWRDAGDCVFDLDRAQRSIDFFHELITHTKGHLAGQPFHLEPWEQAVVGNLFGWRQPDGYRRYREAFLFLPRKNGKSSLAAGIGIQVLTCDHEPGAEMYSCAADRDQARLVFAIAKRMVEQEELLAERCQVFTNAITLEEEGSSYQAVSSDASTKHGYNVHCAIIDELHAHKSRDLVDAMITGTASRKQPLILHVTTSDFDRPSICNEKHDYASKVRDGVIADPSFLPVIYEAQRDDDWTSPEVWAKANPNFGVSVPEEYLERECRRAQESPVYENTFKRLHLNIRTEQAIRWLQMDHWDYCATVPNQALLEGKQCFAGLDLSSTTDLSALVLAFPDEDGGFDVLPFFWVPGEGARQRERNDRVPYETWGAQGHLELTQGNVIDYDLIRRRINELSQRFHIREIAVDRWNSTQLQTQLDGDGLEVVQYGQGFASMTDPTKALHKLVKGGKIRHGGHPVLRWNASNVVVDMDASENVRPNKAKSSERIDGIVALIMAIGRSLSATEEEACVYETRGIPTL